jgi:DNA-binding HxlR family transcriptional regulator
MVCFRTQNRATLAKVHRKGQIPSMGRTANYSKQSCTIAGTLEVIGDPWTLLVIRDAFRGVRRFEQWQDGLGVARNVLAARLKTLVAHGIMEARPYSERPLRNEYVLTQKGKDLRTVLLTLHGWGEKYIYGEQDSGLAVVHKGCGHPLDPIVACNHCKAEVKLGDVEMIVTPDRPTVGEVMGPLEAAE